MRLSEQWLREWVDPDIDTKALAEQLTMAGLEVEAIEPAAPPLDGVVVARIVATRPHPEADRLQVCEVDDGQGRLTIVCGAANARPGLVVPLARIGASLPGGVDIRQARLRGVDSYGMLCSATELGLADHAEGLFELPADFAPGQSIREALALDDLCIEIALTPNRGDCLSIAGIAREVAALNDLPMTGSSIETVAAVHERRLGITVEDPAACPRYVGRIVTSIDAAAASPIWLQERLRRCGLRSLGPVVDVTNLVMLELGQPMHAFDADRIEGGIEVRRSREGEGLALLDGREVSLIDDSLVIADASGPLALAGIMGGTDSAVSTTTRTVFLEAAHFTPAAMAGKARAYSIQTDSSYRFERGVDETLPERAIERATRLLLEIVGGKPGPVTSVLSARDSRQLPLIPLRPHNVERLLGLSIAADEIVAILERLGMTVEMCADGWRVRPPAYRFDLSLEADLIEEIARMYGYDRLPASRPRGESALMALPDSQKRLQSWLRQALVDRGYHEAVSYSFVDPDWQRRLDPEHEPITLSNPLASDISVMRTSLLPGLLQAVRHNQSRRQPRIRLFEIGRRFLGPLPAHDESVALGCAITGQAYPLQWQRPPREVDFFDLKGDIEETLGGIAPLAFVSDLHPALHPGRTARINDEEGRSIGWLGALHPTIGEALGIEGEVLLCEIALAGFPYGKPPRFEPISRYPVIQRDLAVLVGDTVPASELIGAAREAAGEQLADIALFDVYVGKGVEPGFKSMAIHLTFQDISRTLSDEDADRLVANVLSGLAIRCGARLRE